MCIDHMIKYSVNSSSFFFFKMKFMHLKLVSNYTFKDDTEYFILSGALEGL